MTGRPAAAGLLLDLDGVVYVAGEAVPGAADAVAWASEARVPYLFLTNTTSRPRSAVVAKLRRLGVEAAEGQVLTPAVAARDWLRRHGVTRPALFVPEATAEELAGLDPLGPDEDGPAGAVVVGDLGAGWDFATLNRAFRLLVTEPRPPLLALGLTRFWRADDGLRLDAGPYVRALEYAAGTEAVVLGKPDPGFYAAAVDALGLDAEQVVMVGDDVRGDVGGAQRAGLTGVLVRTGKFTPADLDGDVVPDAVLASVADLPAWWAGAAPAPVPLPGPVTAAATGVTAFVGRAPGGPVGEPTPVTSFADYERTFGGLAETSTLGHAVLDFFTAGGRSAVVVRLEPARGDRLEASDYVGGGPGSGTGLHALERAGFDLLVLPAESLDSGVPRGVPAAAAALCEDQRAVLLLDPPPEWADPTAAVTGDVASVVGTASPNAAVYLPRIRRPDPLRGGAPVEAAPAGAVAGVIARTDLRHGVWKAPAGVDAALTGVTGVVPDLTEGQVDALTRRGLNCLRTLPSGSTVAWGARTLRGADGAGQPVSEWRYLPVRRTALFLERSIARSTAWTVFEPNDEPLWARLRILVGDFLHGLFLAGAFAGTRPQESYVVRCGRDTTTAADIAAGRLGLAVGFAALRPAEFVVLRLDLAAQAP